MKYPRFCFAPFYILLLGLLSLVPSLKAQTTPSGTIEGRVSNPRTGENIERARVTVEGTLLESFTDSSGQYRLTNVPAGVARVKVFYTGLTVQTDSVNVTAGATTQRDFTLAVGAPPPAAARGDVVKLDQFVVATSKQMDGAAIAINEQRFAANIRNVVSADEFGTVVEGNVGDFLKFLPGITVDTTGGDARTISMNGVPANNVPITVGGFSLASAQSSGTSRQVELEQFSINNIARFEVLQSPTPESPGSALAGSINMVPRSAFERSRPTFSGSVFLMMKNNARSLDPSPGPRRELTHKIKPGYEFSGVVPVNKRFGFTFSSAFSDQYTNEDFTQNTWRGAGAATSGAVAATATTSYPDTALDRPYMTDYAVQDAAKFSKRQSFGFTVDYRLAQNDRISVSFQWAFFDAELSNRKLTFSVQRVAAGNFDPTFTHGEAGKGQLQLDNTGMREKSGTTYTPTFVYRHDGTVWKLESGIGQSHASNHYKDAYRGFFNNSTTRRTNVTINFDDIFYLRPGEIAVFDGTTAQPLDPFNLSNYTPISASNQDQESADLQRTFYGNARRDFDLRGIALAFKGGLDLKQSTRDIRKYAPSWNYLGDDNRSVTTPVGNNASHNASLVLDDNFSKRTLPYGFPQMQWVSQEELWELYQAHPTYFSLNSANSAYRSLIDQSKYARETISSLYLRSDVAFFERRLKFIGGVRAEQTNLTANGPLSDPTRNYQHNASGVIQHDAAGKPILIVPTSNALGVSQLTYIDRGQNAEKEYLRLFPSMNASFNVRENIIARAAWYTSIGRPDYNQYTGGLTLPDTDLIPSNSNRISVNNVGIKPWSAQTTKVRLEYYFDRVGQVSIGAFRRDFKNFFGSLVTPATPEFLALYNLDPAVYERFDVSTNYNLASKVLMTGVEFDYKQALTFLPSWARGVQGFANASAIRATGDGTANFTGFVPRSISWGLSVTRPKFNLRANWNYRGRSRGAAVTGRGIEPGTFNWTSKRLYLDINGEYRIRQNLAVFGSVKNMNNATEDFKIFGPNTPELARFRQRTTHGSAWVFGLRGSY